MRHALCPARVGDQEAVQWQEATEAISQWDDHGSERASDTKCGGEGTPLSKNESKSTIMQRAKKVPPPRGPFPARMGTDP